MKLIIDTNAYVAFKLNHFELVEYVTKADKIILSPIVIGELLFGFRGGSKFDKNLKELNNFIEHSAVEITNIAEITSDRYFRIALRLKKNGTPIPTNDIWLAAQTMETGAELVTLNRHFEKIENLVFRLFS